MVRTLFLFLALIVVSCQKEENKSSDSETLSEKSGTPTGLPEPGRLLLDGSGVLLVGRDLNDSREFELPKGLDEVSGLALFDGNIVAHNDEEGTIFLLDSRDGALRSRFFVGRPIRLREDFEGIARVGTRLILVNSAGDLFGFDQGKEDESVAFTTERSPLSTKHDIEGLAYDSTTNSLLFVTKEFPGKGFDRKRVRTIWAFDLDAMRYEDQPRIALNVSAIAEELDIDEFLPSALEVDPASGHLLVLSSKEPAIVEIDRNGNILDLSKLDEDDLPQPEGLALLPDGRLFIASEGGILRLFEEKD